MASPGGPIQNLKATNEFVQHDSKRIQVFQYEPNTFSETIIIRGTITQCCVYDMNDYNACILM